jgi:hypothetical protein
MNKTEKTWLSAYLYRTGSWQTFLTEAVNPFVTAALAEGLAEQFFFIRYGERGPHIRLRLKGERSTIEQRLKPRLESYFLDYFAANPTQRVDPPELNDLPPEQQWFPNDSIQFIDYEPEVKRYGGPTGILIAEKQFEASSRAVLSILAANETWNYQRALGAASQLHLGFVFALGMALEEAKQFFTYIYALEPSRLPAGFRRRRGELTRSFEEKFNQQKAILLPFYQQLWQALVDGITFEQAWLNEWVKTMIDIGLEWKQSLAQGLLNPSGLVIRYGEGAVEFTKNNHILWSIIASNFHMTNNRLGIVNEDEAYLG